jgi:signal transduction histidine kinase
MRPEQGPADDQRELQQLRERLAATTATVEHQRRLLEAVPATADVALVAIDPDGRCQVVGGRHQALLARTYVEGADGCTETTGSVFDANGARALEHDELPSVRASRGEEFDHLQVWLGADLANRRAFSVSARCLRDEQRRVVGALLTYRDVDEYSRTQQLHDLFLRSMSHELRTPLASVLGRLELLAERDDLPSDVSRLVVGAHRNAGRLSHLVADMLEVVEVREGGLSIHVAPTDVAELARGAVEAARDAATAGGVTVTYDGPDRLPASLDADRVRQAVDHLVTNAVKFTDRGGAVNVRVARQDQRVVVDVEDTGVGIDADEADLVFGRFFRGRAAHRRAAAGTGIGLWVVRNVVQAHGGHVELEPVLPHGTLFRAVLTDQVPAPRPIVDDRGTGARWHHSPDAAWVDRGDRVMALDLARPGARPQALEGVAAVIWRLLDQPRSVDALLEALATDFAGADPDRMRHDVEQFLSDLAVAGLARSVSD